LTDKEIEEWADKGTEDRWELDDYEYNLITEGRIEGAKWARDKMQKN
jgi:hypothetical protein